MLDFPLMLWVKLPAVVDRIHRFQKKKTEVAPKRGLIALAINIQSNMANEEERPISLAMIFTASV